MKKKYLRIAIDLDDTAYKYDIPFYELKNLILNDLNYEKK